MKKRLIIGTMIALVVVAAAGFFIWKKRAHNSENIRRAMFDLLDICQKALVENKNVLGKEEDVLAGIKKTKTDDCPAPFQKAWNELASQMDATIEANKKSDANSFINFLTVIPTHGAPLADTDKTDKAKGTREALDKLYQICVDYGIE